MVRTININPIGIQMIPSAIVYMI